jgi:hypothetical protein
MRKLKTQKLLVLPLLFAMVFILGCEDKQEEPPIRPARIFPREAPSAGRDNSEARGASSINEVYAWQGDNLYAIDASRPWLPAEQIGADWTGTEAAVVVDNNIYYAQRGHLWKNGLFDGSWQDLGCCWDGTERMTYGRDGYLYIIQANRLWKTNATTGTFVQLGSAYWGGSQSISCSGASGSITIVQNNITYIVSRSNGSFTSNSTHVEYPKIHIYTGPAFNCSIFHGRVESDYHDYYSDQNWAGASAIAFGYGDPYGRQYIFILKDGVVTRAELTFAASGYPTTGGYFLYGAETFPINGGGAYLLVGGSTQ